MTGPGAGAAVLSPCVSVSLSSFALRGRRETRGNRRQGSPRGSGAAAGLHLRQKTLRLPESRRELRLPALNR